MIVSGLAEEADIVACLGGRVTDLRSVGGWLEILWCCDVDLLPERGTRQQSVRHLKGKQ